MERTNFEIIGVPICCGSPTNGTQKACDILYEKLKIYNLPYTKIECKNSRTFKNNSYSPTQVKSCVKKLYKVTNGVYNRNKIPFILGGDHSLSIGSVASSLRKHGDDLLVVWIDGHVDINTLKSSVSHYIHGMPNAVSLGLFGKKLSPCHCKYKLKGKNLVVLGARSIDEAEYKILESNKVKYYNVDEIRKFGIENLINEIKKKTNVKHVHISFDVDCLDPNEFMATGYNLDNGFKINEVKEIIDLLTKKFNLSLFECVEYNPTLDNDNKDLDKILQITKHILG